MTNRGFASFGIVVLVLLVGIVAGVVGYILLGGGDSTGDAGGVIEKASEMVGVDFSKANAGKEIKTLHFVNSAPAHGEVFAEVPSGIVINFDFDLSQASQITIVKGNDKIDYGVGTTNLDRSGRAMKRDLPSTLSDGTYTVTYKACWPDNTCHDGQFGFVVDSKKKTDYKDLTGQKEVAITIKGLEFNPEKIVIRKGTKVTWANEDTPTHYVNTDPHPGHNMYISLNSDELITSNIYSYVFTEVGEYPYHCSLHYPGMRGRILVVE